MGKETTKPSTKPPVKSTTTLYSYSNNKSGNNNNNLKKKVGGGTTTTATATSDGGRRGIKSGVTQRTTTNGKGPSFPTSTSTPSLSSVSNEPKARPRRPVSSVFTNITVRKGQSSKVEAASTGGSGGVVHHHHHNNDDLLRSSSLTNLNAGLHDQQQQIGGGGGGGGGTKSKSTNNKKIESKVRNDRKTSLTTTNTTAQQQSIKNNNRDYDFNMKNEFDVELLQKQLTEMANEKSNLALQLGEQTGQVHSLQTEVTKLKVFQEQATQQLEQLVEENTLLRNRLRDVAHSPLSDNEKQQILYESRHHSSAPASIATNLLDDGGDVTACPTPEWDKHSSSNVSEVSVACLQDKINQMQETHYSTNEELQATLQELTDLQRQLTELQQENERLIEEKNLMFESLCRQTERLNDSRSEVESLKKLLYNNDENGGGHFETAAEREQKLVDLLKSAQEERETLLLKQQQLDNDLQDERSANMIHTDEILQLSNRVRTLESTIDAKHAEHKLLDQELAQAKDQSSSRQIEINRLKDLLENAKAKINELEQDRALSDKSELDELLDNARKEKDALESEVAHLKEQLALSRNEIEKLKEQVSILQEECKVIRNNARTTQSDLEYRIEKLLLEKAALSEQLEQFQEALNELQVQTQCQQEDKRHLSAVLSETQRNLNESERRAMSLESELAELKRLKLEQEEEWERFQNDLLTSVRVANDFKTEAQQDLQRMIMENKAERERVKQLEAQIDKLKVTTETLPLRPSSFPVDDLTTRRQKAAAALNRQTNRQSVKSLIESIENATKPICGKNVGGTTISRSSSGSSINSMASENNIKTPSTPLCNTTTGGLVVTTSSVNSGGSPIKTPINDWTNNEQNLKTPLKEQQPNKLNRDWSKTSITDTLMVVKTKPVEDSFNNTSILSKNIDYTRRNSYSDLNERKDPLNSLVKNGGSKRNALLKWCQNKTVGYRNIDITNFSSSWNDGLALCALLHTYLPDRIPYDSLTQQEKRRNFSLAFSAAESVGITTTLNINDMIQLERPDWQQVMSYVTAIYKHFET